MISLSDDCAGFATMTPDQAYGLRFQLRGSWVELGERVAAIEDRLAAIEERLDDVEMSVLVIQDNCILPEG